MKKEEEDSHDGTKNHLLYNTFYVYICNQV